AWMGAALGLLVDTALDAQEATAGLLLMPGHARRQAIVNHGYTDQARATGLSPGELDRRGAEAIGQPGTAGQVPARRGATGAGGATAGDDPLAFGLERLLDGVARYVAARADGAPSAMPEQADEPPETDAYPKDAKVRAARLARREAEKAAREAQK